MTPREQQAAEIKTIKPREITINLSDADVERLFVKAYSNGLTPSELIEGFLGDLLDGTYSHGSDERDLADEYFERCCYDMGLQRTFLQWALYDGCCDNLINLIDDYDTGLEVLADWENEPEMSDEIQREMDIDKQTFREIQGDISDIYNEYVKYSNRRNDEPQTLEDGIAEIRQYCKSLDEIRSGNNEECAEDSEDEQLEP